MRHAIENIKASRKSRNSDNLVWGMLHKRQNMDILILRDLPIFFFSFSFFTVCNLHDLQLKSIIWQDICKVVWNFQVLLQHVETIFSSSLCYFGGFFLVVVYFCCWGFFNLCLMWMSLVEGKGEKHLYENSFWDGMQWFHTAKLQHCLFWGFLYWWPLMY